MFGLFKKPNDKQEKVTPEDNQRAALLRAIAESKDPLAGAKIGAKEVINRLLNAMKNEKGVHAESFLCILGSLAGYSCQVSIRKEYIDEKGMMEKEVFTVVKCSDGSRYYFGDMLNKPLVESQYSIWSLAAGAVQHLGGNRFIDIQEVFGHVSKTVGSTEFGVPRMPEGHNTGDIPYNYVKMLWPVFFPAVKDFCTASEWPILFGLAVQEGIIFCKDVIDPSFALSIVMESAIPMSKIDLKL